MPNPMKGEVSFTAGEEEYTLLLDWEAMFAIEDALDQPIDIILGQIGAASEGRARIKLGTMATVLACGLQTYHPGFTRGDAGALLVDHGDEIGKALGLAVERATPKSGDPGAHPAKPAAKIPASSAKRIGKPKR
jgi:hypothetical protein